MKKKGNTWQSDMDDLITAHPEVYCEGCGKQILEGVLCKKCVEEYYEHHKKIFKEIQRKNMRKLYIVIGKSGSGKNYVPELFGLRYVPGNTTRGPRPNDPKDLTYADKSGLREFRQFATGVTNFDNNLYWTWIEDLNNDLYDYAVLGMEGLQDFLQTPTKMNLAGTPKNSALARAKQKKEIVNRKYEIIYFKTSLLNRIKNMRKRGDNYKDIIRRILHDRKAFCGAEKYVLSYGGKILNS